MRTSLKRISKLERDGVRGILTSRRSPCKDQSPRFVLEWNRSRPAACLRRSDSTMPSARTWQRSRRDHGTFDHPGRRICHRANGACQVDTASRRSPAALEAHIRVGIAQLWGSDSHREQARNAYARTEPGETQLYCADFRLAQINATYCSIASTAMVFNAGGVPRPGSTENPKGHYFDQVNLINEVKNKFDVDKVLKQGVTLDTYGQFLSFFPCKPQSRTPPTPRWTRFVRRRLPRSSARMSFSSSTTIARMSGKRAAAISLPWPRTMPRPTAF